MECGENMDSLLRLANNIKFFRDKRGWSQEFLSQHLNNSRSTISKWETGKEIPSLIDALELCKLFDITLDQLCGINPFTQGYLLEFNNNYPEIEKEIHDELKDVVDYLIQNPQMMIGLTKLSKLKPNERKKYESVILHMIEELVN